MALKLLFLLMQTNKLITESVHRVMITSTSPKRVSILMVRLMVQSQEKPKTVD
jgi:hypothetical protein